MTTTVRDNAEQHRYELVEDDHVVGIADYAVHGDTIVMPHTVIDPKRRGEGLGAVLVRGALDDIRGRGLIVDPQCWYVAEFINGHREYLDLTAGRMTDSTYFAAGHADLEERARLDLLETELDPASIAHLRALGVGDSGRTWRCLEVAGGGGSIARWMADAVGPEGTVTVTDIDTRFLDALASGPGARPNVQVRRHDLVAEQFEPLAYDLVHCRLLLVHLPDATAAVERLAAAVAPGGALVLEEFEYATLQVADAGHPLAAAVTRVNDALLAFTLSAGIDVYIGRRLPDLLESAGLTDVGHQGTLRITRGTPSPTMAKASTALLAPRLTDRGLVSADDLRAWFTALSDPAFRMIDYALVSAWGHRPQL